VLSTRDIAIYAAIVATADVAWTLFQGLIRDRARIVVSVGEYEAITPGRGERQPVLGVRVANRGRRTTYITHVSRVADVWRGKHELSADIMRQLQNPLRLDESQGQTLTHGHMGGYGHGDIRLSRWYVTDGAGRMHPLRERYRQKVERVILWPARRLLKWRDSRRDE
jgi:hypothetical protein